MELDNFMPAIEACHSSGRARVHACRKKPAEGPPALPKAGAKPEGEATDLSPFFSIVCIYFLRFSPKNRVSSPKTT
jgi:hypothetical protein